MSIGKRLRVLRELTGLNQSQLSHTCGFPRGYIGLLEEGRRADPWATTLAVVSATLGCTLDYLVLGIGPEPHAAEVLAAIARANRDPDSVRKYVERAVGVVIRRRRTTAASATKRPLTKAKASRAKALSRATARTSRAIEARA